MSNTKRSSLFQSGDFVSAAGPRLSWKIECDSLTDTDWKTIAEQSVDHLPKFRQAVGVPRGGLTLAGYLNEYADPSSDLILVVDDVWTTGKSMTSFVLANLTGHWRGFVAFSRGELPDYVTCFAQVHPGESLSIMAENAALRAANTKLVLAERDRIEKELDEHPPEDPGHVPSLDYNDGYTHEALHTTSVLMDTFERNVIDTRCSDEFPDIREVADKVHQAMFDLYQLIATKFKDDR
jgi:hypothetical protein